MKNWFVKKKGFTLIEILIVLGIISTILLVGLGSYGIVQKKMRLEIAANTMQSIIAEARDKSKVGYYETGANIISPKSLCFGFRLTPGEFVELITTKYDRLQVDQKCSTLDQDIQKSQIQDLQNDIVIKKIEKFNEEITDPLDLFFAPPFGDIEVIGLSAASNPEIIVTVGYLSSENVLDQRQIVLNALTGSVYIKKGNEQNVQNQNQ
jgi:prepilin-type N-terminal cleavage/methylation domain-containing protein